MDGFKLDPKELFGDGVQFLPTDEIKGIYTYLQSLDWNEPWLYGLITFHFGLLVTILLTRRITSVQSGIFLVLLVLVYEAEDLNEYLSKNHKFFTKHQYFDSPGLFISIVMSFPFLLFCSMIVINWFYVSTQLMKQLKIQQIERSRKREEKQAVEKTDVKREPESKSNRKCMDDRKSDKKND